MTNAKEAVWKDRYSSQYDDNHNDYLSRIEEDCILIHEMGAIACSFGPGISIETPGEGAMHLDAASWNWLRPILIELVNSRKNFRLMRLQDDG
jgi:hypothetical protein